MNKNDSSLDMIQKIKIVASSLILVGVVLTIIASLTDFSQMKAFWFLLGGVGTIITIAEIFLVTQKIKFALFNAATWSVIVLISFNMAIRVLA